MLIDGVSELLTAWRLVQVRQSHGFERIGQRPLFYLGLMPLEEPRNEGTRRTRGTVQARDDSERARDKGKEAFEIIKMLKDKKFLKLNTVSEFIDIMDELIKIL